MATVSANYDLIRSLKEMCSEEKPIYVRMKKLVTDVMQSRGVEAFTGTVGSVTSRLLYKTYIGAGVDSITASSILRLEALHNCSPNDICDYIS